MRSAYLGGFLKFYFFSVFGCAGSSLVCGLFSSCGMLASHCRGCSCWGAPGHVGSVVTASGLWSTGSIVVVHGLGGLTACGIFLHQGSNSCLLHWQVDSLLRSHQGSPILHILVCICWSETLNPFLPTPSPLVMSDIIWCWSFSF